MLIILQKGGHYYGENRKSRSRRGSFVKVVRAICVGFAFVCAVLFVVTLVLSTPQYDHMVAFADRTLSVGSITLTLAHGLEPINSTRPALCAMLLYGTLILTVYSLICGTIVKLLAPMAQARPFDGAVALSFRRLGVLFLLYALVKMVMSTTVDWLLYRSFDLNELFLPGLVQGVNITYTVDFSYFILPAILFFLSWIFRYGEELQRQSDETL